MPVKKRDWVNTGIGARQQPVFRSVFEFDFDEIMILDKPGVRGQLDSSGRPPLNASIHNRIVEVARTKNIPFEYLSYQDTPQSPQLLSQFTFLFKQPNEKDGSRGKLEIGSVKTTIYLDLKDGVNGEPLKSFLIECLNQVIREAVIFIATTDANEGRKMDQPIVDLAGGKHDDLAALYAETYVKITEKKNALLPRDPAPKATGFMGLFGKKGGKTRKSNKSRSRKQKKTRKH